MPKRKHYHHIIGALLIALVQNSPLQANSHTVYVDSGDEQGLIDAIVQANLLGTADLTYIYLRDTGEDFLFTESIEGYGRALPTIMSHIRLQPADPAGRRIAFSGNGSFEMVTVTIGSLNVRGLTFTNFGTGELSPGFGSVFSIKGATDFVATDVHFLNNNAASGGAAIFHPSTGSLQVEDCLFEGNSAGSVGGAILVDTPSDGKLTIENSRFLDNTAGLGCALSIEHGASLNLSGSVFSGCNDEMIDVFFAALTAHNSAIVNTPRGLRVEGHDIALFANLIDAVAASSTKASCTPDWLPGIETLGFNITSDASCSTDAPSDLTMTDPQLSVSDGVPLLAAGSPAVESALSELITFPGDDLPALPCGYKDVTGLGRPQDFDGDGVFTCDRGPVELTGPGEIVAQHSGPFYNSDRNGEGIYAEVISDELSLIYTFSFDPLGNHPMWMLGVGKNVGNSIVIDDLELPTGARFGSAFDSSEIEYRDGGSMSVVFPDCQAEAEPGNIVYTGNENLGYEPLITTARRLAEIVPCGAAPVAVNAGLSGSFYDPDRNGEGIIVEWLSNGMVVVVWFTYDQDGNQLWLLGVGEADGNSVTLTMEYPTGLTRWGSDFDASAVILTEWGTVTITHTDCDSLSFGYDSTAGFGSGSYNYRRITSLLGTTCAL